MTFIDLLMWSVRNTVLISQNSLFICEETFPPKKKARKRNMKHLDAGRASQNYIPPGPISTTDFNSMLAKVADYYYPCSGWETDDRKKRRAVVKSSGVRCVPGHRVLFQSAPRRRTERWWGGSSPVLPHLVWGKKKNTHLSTQRWSPKTLFG